MRFLYSTDNLYNFLFPKFSDNEFELENEKFQTDINLIKLNVPLFKITAETFKSVKYTSTEDFLTMKRMNEEAFYQLCVKVVLLTVLF